MLLQGFIVTLTAICTLVGGQEATKGCKTEDGKEVKAGEQVEVRHHCVLRECKGDGEWMTTSCPDLGHPVGWTWTFADMTKGKYPDCCSKLIPPQEIVPDVLDAAPGTEYVEVIYDENLTARLDNELTPTQVKAEPTVKYSWADPNFFYLLIMTDPDAPSRQKPESREFVHWMVGNIPGDQVKSGEVIAGYIGSGPPKGSGLHRYFFLVFKQPKKLTFDETKIDNTTVGWRRKFSTRKFAEKYGLGNPEAVNLYQAQYDDYVPELYKQLGFVPPKSGENV